MKLIHCADLHLESRMDSSFSVRLAKDRRRELLLTYKRMIAYAAEQGVAAVLIAGDLFDSGKVSRRAVRDVLSEMQARPEITFFYLCGNHDKNNLSSLSALPENCKTFSAEWRSYPVGDVVVTGIERFDESAAESLSLDPSARNVVMLHGQLSSGASGNWNVNLKSLAGKYIDYLALGHIHSHSFGRIDGRGKYAYSGCLEGRGFDECGEKGFLLLETEGREIESTFVPFASMALHAVNAELDASLVTRAELEARTESAVKDIPASDMVRVSLTGERGAELTVDTDYLSRVLSEKFRFAKVIDASRLAVTADDYKNDVSLKGEFVRLVRGSKLTPEEQDKILECGIRALRGEDI